MEGSSDLLTKYQKIAAEYSKLRSQLPVLKKAVTEEQTRCAELKEILRVKDQSLRIAKSEADSLNFRNNQLTCRVTILLEELEELRNPKHDKKNTIKRQDSHAHNPIDEEFNRKIVENAELKTTLQEYQERHEVEVKELLDEINLLKLELATLKEREATLQGDCEVHQERKLEERSPRGEENMNINSDYGSSKTPDHNFKTALYSSDKNSNVQSANGRRIEKLYEVDPYSDYNNTLVASSVKESRSHVQENSVGWAIQKALEKQLLETQQFLEKTKSEYENLNTTHKALENKYKELQDKFVGHAADAPSSLKGKINYIPDEEAQAREVEIKKCYQRHIDILNGEVLLHKSKLVTLEKEVVAMKMRLESETQRRSELSAQLEAEKLNVQKVKDELTTTTTNYDAQLSAMSDHLASLNDIISKQKDEIDTLQYHMDMGTKKCKK